MVKVTLKLLVVGLIANALYQVVPAYYTFYQFRDAVKEVATFPGFQATVPSMQLKCAKIAREYGLALTADDFDVKLPGPGGKTPAVIDVSYELVLKPIPGRPWPRLFAIHAVGDAPRFGSVTP